VTRSASPIPNFAQAAAVCLENREHIAERPFADHIRADRRVEQRRIWLGRRLGIHDRRQRPVFDRNLLECVLAVSRLRANTTATGSPT
jgi:hypothetical protein